MTSWASTKVLIVAGMVPPERAALGERLSQLRRLGAEIDLACNFDAELLSVDASVAARHVLPSLTDEYPPNVRRKLLVSSAPRKVWIHLRRNPTVYRRAREADVVVALDRLALYAVWELAQRHRRPAVVNGLEPALWLVGRHRGHPVRPARGYLASVPAWSLIAYHGLRQAARTGITSAVRSAISPAVLRTALGSRFWCALVLLPGLSDGLRQRLLYAVHVNMLKAGRGDTALRASARGGRLIRDRRVAADLLIRQALAELRYGTPASLAAAMQAGYAIADDHLRRKAMRKVAPLINQLMALLFHRALHVDRLTSPLVDDPAGYLAQWRQCDAVRRLTAPRGRQAHRAPAPTDRPLRLLIATNSAEDFLMDGNLALDSTVRHRYEDMPDVEVRLLDFAQNEGLAALAITAKKVVDHVLMGHSVYGNRVEALLRPHLEWADTVLVEGCAAALLTLIDPHDSRVVFRLHGAELYHAWPHLLDFSRIDDVVFASEHVKAFAVEVLAPLSTAQAPRLHVFGDGVNVHLAVNRSSEARFALGVIGVDAVAKDPRWAVEVLRILHEGDSRYRLMLVGDGLDCDASEDVARYDEALARAASHLGGAVTRHAHVGDMRQVLTEIGVIVNSSLHEGFPRGLVEGAASGCVPVVRNWPFFAQRSRGAHTEFPREWVVDTPVQAAERILACTATEETWRKASRDAAEYSARAWRTESSLARFDQLLLGPAAPVIQIVTA